MTREDANKWCLKNGITPSTEEAIRSAVIFTWANAANNGRVINEARKRLANVGIALGWDRNAFKIEDEAGAES